MSSTKPTAGIVCDASCRGDKLSRRRDGYFHGRVEWQIMDLSTGRIAMRSRVYDRSTVNLGEFCAIVDSLAHLYARGDHSTPVYSDSYIAIGWYRDGAHRSKLPYNENTRDAIIKADEAAHWLKTNKPRNPVLKWKTDIWGESPADFGRK